MSRKRQWGADRRTTPLPPVATPASDRQITFGRLEPDDWAQLRAPCGTDTQTASPSPAPAITSPSDR